MNYSWKIISHKKIGDGTVVQVYWTKTGTDESGNSADFSGSVPFELEDINEESYVPYEELTDDIILGWVQSIVVGDYEIFVDDSINAQIQAKLNPELAKKYQ